MRSFAIDEPGSSVRALYATLVSNHMVTIGQIWFDDVPLLFVLHLFFGLGVVLQSEGFRIT